MKLVSLKLSKADAREEVGLAPSSSDLPTYPYGTCLHLDEDELKKLGIEEMPEVGTEFPIEAVVTVSGTSERESQSGKSQCLDLQITKMGIGIDESKKKLSKLYPSASDSKPE